MITNLLIELFEALVRMSPPVTCLDAEPVQDGDGAAAVDDHRHDHDEKGRAADQSEVSIVTIHQSQLT